LPRVAGFQTAPFFAEKAMIGIMKHSRGETIFYLAVAAALAAVFCALPPLGLYSNEEGVRYVQMKNFALNGSLSIPYPGENLGLEPEALVKGGGYFRLRDGKIQTLCAPLFPYLTSLVYPLFGDRAIHFLPLFFFFLTLVVLGRTLILVMKPGGRYFCLLLVYLLGSPVFLFLFGFAENTAVVFLVTVALYFLVRHYRRSPSAANFFFASLSMGGAVFFSSAALFIFASFVLAGGLVFCWDKRWRDLSALMGGALAAIAALMISDGLLYGQIPGPYLADFFHDHPLSETRIALFAAILSLSLLISFIARRAGLGASWVPVSHVLLVILLMTAVLITSARHSVLPFVLSFPAVLFTFYGIGGCQEARAEGRGSIELILAGTVLICLLLASSVVRPNDWTTLKACLPTVPLAVLAMGLSGDRLFRYPGMYGLLALTAAIALFLGIGEAKANFWRYTVHNDAQVDFQKRQTGPGDVIIFDNMGSMEHAGPLFFDRVFLVARGRQIEPLLQRLREMGVKQCHVWTRDTQLKFQIGNPYDDRKKELNASLSRCGSCTASCMGGFSLLHVELEREQTVEKNRKGRPGGRSGQG